MYSNGTMEIKVKGGNTVKVEYFVKHYEEPSEEFGLDGGRISKLSLRIREEWVTNYDREWDIKPNCEAAEKALSILVKKYN